MKTVTILTPENVCIGPYQAGPECGCLQFWRDRDFTRHGRHWRVYVAECEILFRMIGTYTTHHGDRFTRKQIAQARNRATAVLGYVVGNPEAKWAEKHWREFDDILTKYKIKREA